MTRRKDGRYQERFTVNGKPKYFYGKTKAEVLRKINEYKEKEAIGKSFKDVAEEWSEIHFPSLAPNSVNRSYSIILHQLIDYFDKPIKTIKNAEIEKMLLHFANRGYSYNKVKSLLTVTLQIFGFAVKNEYVPYNVAKGSKIPLFLKPNKRSLPSDEDIEKIKKNKDTPTGRFAFFLLYTGMRKGELLALEKKDINLDKRTIMVNKTAYTVNGKTYFKAPKSVNGIRDIPILDKLMPEIQHLKEGRLFPYTESHINYLWEQFTKHHKISCTMHQLRHAFATLLFENEISILDAAEILGHTPIMTENIYTHIRETHRKEVHNKLYSADI